MEKYLHPTHSVHCITPGPSECGKSFFLAHLT